MPAVQRTFELVPTSLTRAVARPPMTSKAAKKAYQKAQSGPKISRAEQRKRDAEILEKLRKEHEKERSAAKAKAAREKKAAKAAEEREERRRMGLPEPRKGVRGNTARGGEANAKRNWREAESVVEEEEALGHDVAAEAEPPAKRVALDYEYQKEDPKLEASIESAEGTSYTDLVSTDDLPIRTASLEHDCQMGITKVEDQARPIEMKIAVDADSEDEFGEFPSLTQADILERLASSVCSVAEMAPPPVSSQHSFFKQRETHIHKPLPKPPDTKVILNEDDFDDGMASTQFFTEAIAVVSRIESRKATPVVEANAMDLGLAPVTVRPRSPLKPLTGIKVDGMKTPRASQIQPVSRDTVTSAQCTTHTSLPLDQRPALGERSINMPPPKLPISGVKSTAFASPAVKARLVPQQASRFATPTRSPFIPKSTFLVDGARFTSMAPPPQKPRFLPDNQKKFSGCSSDAPPSATQAFLENNLEDFYPSPTQEKRELDEIMDDVEFLPSNTQISRDISPSKPALNPQPIKYDDFQFPSTQDFMISSQDMCEINTPKSTPINVLKVAPVSSVSRPMSREKRRFFEEKEDDLRQAGLLAAVKLASPVERELVTVVTQAITLSPETPSIQAAIAESKELAEIRRLADATFDNFDDDIDTLSLAMRNSKELAKTKPPLPTFEEEIEAFESTIREFEEFPQSNPEKSKEDMAILEVANAGGKPVAATETQRLELGGSRRYFQEKEEDLVEAALWESKRILEGQNHQIVLQVQVPGASLPAQAQSKPLIPTSGKRTLKRAESGVTDYGDDDDPISSQELLALCDGFDA